MRSAAALGKLIVSTVLLCWLMKSVDVAGLRATVAKLGGGALLLSLIAFTAQAFVMGWRWHRIISILGGTLPTTRAVRLIFVGLFFNQALPSSVGGDAIRVWHLHRDGTAPGLAFSSVAIERGTGVVSIGLLIAAFLPSVWDSIHDLHLQLALLAAGPMLLVGLGVAAIADRMSSTWMPARIAPHVIRLAQDLRRILSRPRAVVEIFALGLLAAMLAFVAAFTLGRALGISLGLPTYVVLVGGAVLFSVLPVSLGGWGLREVGMVALFGAVGVEAEVALVLSVIWGLVSLVIALPGGLMFAMAGAPLRPKS